MKVKEKHKIGPDGRRMDGVSQDAATIHDLRSYEGARHMLGSMRVPVFLHEDDPHEYVFIANFDGTGNDAEGDPNHLTNVGRFAQQLSENRDPRVFSHYVAGPGTQWDFARRLFDGAIGYSHDERVRKMYDKFAATVDRWLAEDPEAKIRVITTGFSRGAEESMSFSRKVHDEGVVVSRNHQRSRVLAPGSIPQAVGLFDPVATGHPTRHDRRVPSSVVAGLQLVARDERRSQFPSSMIIPQGLSADRRLLALTVPGAHSDVGGSYHVDGLARANGNLMIDFIGGLTEPKLLERYQLPERVEDYTAHRSEEHSIIYHTRVFDHLGTRGVRGAQKSAPDCRPVVKCALPEETSEEVLAQVPDRARVDVGPVPSDVIDLDRVFERELVQEARQLGGQDYREQEASEQTVDVEGHVVRPEPFAGQHAQAVPNAEGRIDPAQDNHIQFSRFPRLDQDSPPTPDPSPTSPAHPTHRDHHLYNSIHDKLTDVHNEEGITLSTQQMDRLTHCSVATAKQCGMSDVSHLSLGEDRQGNLLPEVHLYQAFRGDLDDPRTKWGKLDALEAFNTPVEAASRDLQVANQQMDQVQQDQQMRMAQQQEQAMSMSL
ncbi:DUF2235 domain-containing protein [Luteibacter aegosomaticola]|uniref:T6SS phospholipase effector Tle1-like catalytic domain-containing protein n=1 Tax=Luteibacter aegosomaticola TaxID=2911538 RepID=UPI001FFB52B6|nr:DUF2235 domain-containing protein [Luteibacter aegosomaticola]UPG89137.1 DUF2235 domain-containing protein [Luteibacter aegosomaticola]